MYLPDINVWLALAFIAHAQHPRARAWFNGLAENHRCFFCRFTQQGFLRLANNPRAFPQVAITQTEAWKLYDSFLANPRIDVASEPPMLESMWRQFTQLPQFSPQLWSDAYLAALLKRRTSRSSHLTRDLLDSRICAKLFCNDRSTPTNGGMIVGVELHNSNLCQLQGTCFSRPSDRK
jgi:toxin-antitoxin system PIN domain toxin